MIILHVLATKFLTNVSVTIGTPIPTKPSGQKESRSIFSGGASMRGWIVCVQDHFFPDECRERRCVSPETLKFISVYRTCSLVTNTVIRINPFRLVLGSITNRDNQGDVTVSPGSDYQRA